MFYDEEDVLDILLCQKCQSKYDEPLMLPCGETICLTCINTDKEKNNSNKIECYFCKEFHPIPKNGFSQNKLVTKLLQINSKDIYRGTYFENLRSNLNKVSSYIAKIENDTKNPADFIENHCSTVISEVELAKEQSIIQIDKISKDIIQEILKCQEDTIKKVEKNVNLPNEIAILKTNAAQVYSSLVNFMKKAYTDDTDVIDAIYSSEECKHNLKREIINFKNTLFNSQVPNFQRNYTFNSELLGDFYFEKSKKSFNFDELQKFELDIEFKCKSICILENGNIFVSYPLQFEYLGSESTLDVFAILDPTGKILKKISTDFYSSLVMSHGNSLLYTGYTYSKIFVLEIMDDKLKVQHSIEDDTLNDLKKIGSNNKNIFVLFCDDSFNSFIHVYNWNLELLRNIDYLNYFQCFRIDSGHFNSFRVTDSDLMFRFGREIFILNQDDLRLVKSFFISTGDSMIKTQLLIFFF